MSEFQRWTLAGVYTLSALALNACGGGSDGGSGPAGSDAAVSDQGIADDAALLPDLSMEEATLAEVTAFCQDRATALCTWAKGCVGDGVRASVLGLPGATVETCVERNAAACLDDATDRLERGTMAFEPERIPNCIDRLNRTPCNPGTATEWVHDWREYVASQCNRVVAGTVEMDGDCERATDCNTAHVLCAAGHCRECLPNDLVRDCEATGRSEGDQNVDAECPGGACVQLDSNTNDKVGICSIDCAADKQLCPPGAACLTGTGSAGAPSFYCTRICERDADCDNGFPCLLLNPGTADTTRHCWVYHD